MEERYQYHLKGPMLSSRAVRVRMLNNVEVDYNLTQAAKLVGPDALNLDLRKAEYRLGIQQFIVEISSPCEDPTDSKVKWTKVDATSFDEGLGAFFTARDVQILEEIYRRFHEVTKTEVDDIMGKGVPVAV